MTFLIKSHCTLETAVVKEWILRHGPFADPMMTMTVFFFLQKLPESLCYNKKIKSNIADKD